MVSSPGLCRILKDRDRREGTREGGGMVIEGMRKKRKRKKGRSRYEIRRTEIGRKEAEE